MSKQQATCDPGELLKNLLHRSCFSTLRTNTMRGGVGGVPLGTEKRGTGLGAGAK